MKFIRKSPLFAVILCTGFLLTLAAVAGKDTIYSSQEYHPLKEPVLAVVFTGINDEIYPWQIFTKDVQETSAHPETEAGDLQEADGGSQPEAGTETGEPQEADEGSQPEAGTETGEMQEADEGGQPEAGENAAAGQPSGGSDGMTESEADEGTIAAVMPAAAPETALESPAGEEGKARPTPFRESTEEEYLNHISADIYGDVGIQNAASYEFVQVDESYFDDALFIGDSRTVGLKDYTDLSEHADFMCETSLTVYKVMEEDFAGLGTVEEALNAKNYGKIYLMVGINELGRGTTEDFMEKYTEVVDTLHRLAPDAKIFIQGIMRVSGKKNAEDAIFNNSNINARNNAIATLADNQQIFYIDVNEAVCDEEGNLTADYTFDQIHLLGVYNDLWKQFLLSHGVPE